MLQRRRGQHPSPTVLAHQHQLLAEQLAHPCHIGRWDSLEALAARAYDDFGRLDLLVNNAGMSPMVDASDQMTEALFDKVIAVNLKGPFRLTALLGPRMKAAGGGAVINVTSLGAVRPEPAYGVYAAAKAGLNVLTKAMALEYGPEVRVNAIMAGPFWTDISAGWREEADRTSTSAARRIGRSHEVATTALYLASPASTYVTGAVIALDGGVR